MRAVYDLAGNLYRRLAEEVLLPGVGHSAAEERPDEVNELLTEFLAELKR